MGLFHHASLSKAILERKKERPYVLVEKTDGDCYYLRDSKNNTFYLHIIFYGMVRKPHTGDGFYLSENIIAGMSQNLHSYTFSKKIGERFARPTHDFLKESKEFLIVEYKNGKTILLEQCYG